MPRRKKAVKKTAGAGKRNLNHALNDDCSDPDCEIHFPSVIEDDNQRLTALAWYYVGAKAMSERIRRQKIDDPVRDLLKAINDYTNGKE